MKIYHKHTKSLKNKYGFYDLQGVDLQGVDLSCAMNVTFPKLPSITMLSSWYLGSLSDELTLELMRRDAWAHPKPQAFEVWAEFGDPCPYQNEERFWSFDLRPEIYKPGPPEMRDSDLIFKILKEKGWKYEKN